MTRPAIAGKSFQYFYFHGSLNPTGNYNEQKPSFRYTIIVFVRRPLWSTHTEVQSPVEDVCIDLRCGWLYRPYVCTGDSEDHVIAWMQTILGDLRERPTQRRRERHKKDREREERRV